MEKSRKSTWLRPGRFFCLLFLAMGLLVAVSVYVFCLYVPPLRIAEDTTRITGPLTPEGRIDFTKYLEDKTYTPEMTTDENGYRIFVRTFGDQGGYDNLHYSKDVSASDREFYRKQLYEKLGLDPNIPPSMTFPKIPILIIQAHFRNRGESYDHTLPPKVNRPWTLEDLPMLADWIEEIDAPLDTVSVLLRKPVFLFPRLESPESFHDARQDDLGTQLLPHINLCRMLTRQFTARANYRIAAGEIDGAVEDLLSIYRISHVMQKDGGLLCFLSASVIALTGHSVPIAASTAHPPAQESLMRFFKALDGFPPPRHIEEIYEQERILMLATLQAAFSEPTFSFIEAGFSGKTEKFERQRLRRDPNVVFREVNAVFDTLTGKRPREEFDALINSDLRSWQEEIWLRSTMRGRSQTFARDLLGQIVFSEILHPSNMEDSLHRDDCKFQLKRLALLLLAYKAEHGRFPENDWIERIKPNLGDDPDRFLCCPAKPGEAGKTRYALVRYDRRPADLDTLLLVELDRPVPYDRAVLSVDDILGGTLSSENAHVLGRNAAMQNGAVHFYNYRDFSKERRRLLGL